MDLTENHVKEILHELFGHLLNDSSGIANLPDIIKLTGLNKQLRDLFVDSVKESIAKIDYDKISS